MSSPYPPYPLYAAAVVVLPGAVDFTPHVELPSDSTIPATSKTKTRRLRFCAANRRASMKASESVACGILGPRSPSTTQ